MASTDLELHAEDQQQLLTELPAPRKSHGRWVALAAASGAALVGLAAWHGSHTAPVAKSPFHLGRVTEFYAKVRELKKTDKKDVDVKEVSCDIEALDLELCGDLSAIPPIMCDPICLEGYSKLLIACPKERAAEFSERLEICAKHDKKPKGDGPHELKEEIDDDEEGLESAKCMPYVMTMAFACEMMEEPDPAKLCTKGCQDAIKDLHKECGKELGDEMPLEELTSMCTGCVGSIMQNFAAGPKAMKNSKACGVKPDEHEPGHPFGQKGFKPCAAGCKAAVCELKKSCPGDAEPAPGMEPQEMTDMINKIDAAMSAGKCSC